MLSILLFSSASFIRSTVTELSWVGDDVCNHWLGIFNSKFHKFSSIASPSNISFTHDHPVYKLEEPLACQFLCNFFQKFCGLLFPLAFSSSRSEPICPDNSSNRSTDIFSLKSEILVNLYKIVNFLFSLWCFLELFC